MGVLKEIESLGIKDWCIISKYRHFVIKARDPKGYYFVKFSNCKSEVDPFLIERKLLNYFRKSAISFMTPVILDFPLHVNNRYLIATRSLGNPTIREVFYNHYDGFELIIRQWAKSKALLHNLHINRDLLNFFNIKENSYYQIREENWMEGLKSSKIHFQHEYNLVKETFNDIIQKCDDTLVQIKSIIQGDPSLVNAIIMSDINVGLIDFEGGYIGDIYWDLFGTIRDYQILKKYETSIIDSYNMYSKIKINGKNLAMVRCLAAIDGLSLLRKNMDSIRNGEIQNVTIESLRDIALNQFLIEYKLYQNG